MLAAGHGAIITVCSVNARLPDPAVLDFSVAKALSKELGPHGIRGNTVSPGPVATDLWLGTGGVAQTVSHATGASAEDVERGAARWSPAASPGPPKSPTWSCSWPATGPAT
jgi:NAD(P)-dependent dehydrogenase (short-subunit alcohol dehydrogenase family)